MGPGKKNLRVLISDSVNPWFNIAVEDWIFREFDPACETLYLWRNDRTVVIGRTQNPWTECDLPRMEREGVQLARRATGGGAVYQDLGNSIFTFFSPRESYDRARNNRILIQALQKSGIHADVSGRNDLVVMFPDGPRKFSGSAFRETRDRAFHHGTALLSTDLDRLATYLTPHPKKIQSKGRASVRSRVMNLTELQPHLTHAELTRALIETFFETYGDSCDIQHLSSDELSGLPALQQRYENFSNWDWRFGQSPSFTHTMSEYLSLGFFEFHFQVDEGRISECRVFSDTLFPDLVESLQKSFHGKPYLASGAQEALAQLEQQPQWNELWNEFLSLAERTAFLRQLRQWLAREIEV